MWTKQGGLCTISGMAMETTQRSLRCVSLDRIDSKEGYTRDNVQLVCKWASLAKKDAPNDEMLAIIDELRR